MTTERDTGQRDGIPKEQTERYAELARKYGPGPLALLEQIDGLSQRTERLLAEAERIIATLRERIGEKR